MFTPVILSGGAGTRLWPRARELYPKQLLALTGAHTLLQQTVLRLEGLGAPAPVIVCNEAHRFLGAEQLRELQVAPRATLLEPFGRNTAPAIALGAHAALKGTASAKAAGPVLLVLPADNLIRDIPAFQQAVRAALSAAQAGQLVTFGVVASRAETGYGYIQRGAASGEGVRIARFVEKPNRERARELPVFREPPSGRGGTQGPRGHRDQGRGAGGAQGSRAGREEAGGAAEGARALRVFAPSGGVPSLGQLRQPRERAALPGEAHQGQPRRHALAAAASSPRRALGGGGRHGAHHARRGGLSSRREPVDLHPGRHQASHREPRHGDARDHRGAVGLVSGRRRHRALRGPLRT